MAKADPRVKAAEQLYQSGLGIKEVAERLGIPRGTVSSWKCRDKWQRPGDGDSIATVIDRNAAKNALKKMAAEVDKNEQLTDLQKEFCLHYSARPNATRAYRLASPGCDNNTARREGCRLKTLPHIRAEIARLKAIRREELMIGPDDVLQMMIDIAFADMSEFVEWGREDAPVLGPYGPLMVDNDDGEGEQAMLTKMSNYLHFRDANAVDGTLITEVKRGKDGVGVKIASKMEALRFLTQYFEMNPDSRHRREFDQRRLELDVLRLKAANEVAAPVEPVNDGFLAALNNAAAGAWDPEQLDDSKPEWVGEPEENEDET